MAWGETGSLRNEHIMEMINGNDRGSMDQWSYVSTLYVRRSVAPGDILWNFSASLYMLCVPPTKIGSCCMASNEFPPGKMMIDEWWIFIHFGIFRASHAGFKSKNKDFSWNMRSKQGLFTWMLGCRNRKSSMSEAGLLSGRYASSWPGLFK